MIRTKNEDKKILEMINSFYNEYIFCGHWEKNINIHELVDELNYRMLIPNILSEKGLIAFLVLIFDKNDFKIKTKEIKSYLDLGEKNGMLPRFGQGDICFATKELLKFKDISDDSFRVNINLAKDENPNELFNINKKTLVKCLFCEEEVEIPEDEGYSEVKCSSCYKNFRILTGTVKKTRGRLVAGTCHGPEPISITISNNDELETVNFHTCNKILLTKGDKISFMWKRKGLFNKVESHPTEIINWDTKSVNLL